MSFKLTRRRFLGLSAVGAAILGGSAYGLTCAVRSVRDAARRSVDA